MTNLEGRVILRQRVRAPRRRARKSDLEIICALAERLGHGAALPVRLARGGLRRAAPGDGRRARRLQRHQLRQDPPRAGRVLALPASMRPSRARRASSPSASTTRTARRASTSCATGRRPSCPTPTIRSTSRPGATRSTTTPAPRPGGWRRSSRPSPSRACRSTRAWRARLGVVDGRRAAGREPARQRDLHRRGHARTSAPDTLFAPFHWGGKRAANVLTNPALDPDEPHARVQGVRRARARRVRRRTESERRERAQEDDWRSSATAWRPAACSTSSLQRGAPGPLRDHGLRRGARRRLQPHPAQQGAGRRRARRHRHQAARLVRRARRRLHRRASPCGASTRRPSWSRPPTARATATTSRVLATGSQPLVPPLDGMTDDERRAAARRLRLPDHGRLPEDAGPRARRRQRRRAGRRAARPRGGQGAERRAGCTSPSSTRRETLMNAQLDELGGEMLERQIESHGIFVAHGPDHRSACSGADGRRRRPPRRRQDAGRRHAGAGLRRAPARRRGARLGPAHQQGHHRQRHAGDRGAGRLRDRRVRRARAAGPTASSRRPGSRPPCWPTCSPARTRRPATAARRSTRASRSPGVDVASMGRIDPELDSDEVIQVVETRRGLLPQAGRARARAGRRDAGGQHRRGRQLVQTLDRGDPLPEDPLEVLCPGAGRSAARRAPTGWCATATRSREARLREAIAAGAATLEALCAGDARRGPAAARAGPSWRRSSPATRPNPRGWRRSDETGPALSGTTYFRDCSFPACDAPGPYTTGSGESTYRVVSPAPPTC